MTWHGMQGSQLVKPLTSTSSRRGRPLALSYHLNSQAEARGDPEARRTKGAGESQNRGKQGYQALHGAVGPAIKRTEHTGVRLWLYKKHVVIVVMLKAQGGGGKQVKGDHHEVNISTLMA